ncbi:hypothetical protein [Peribacillus sp. SCS-155]|uniref:hypothetical protein n=1 Tax=Peribacillus sedimenti TaxID=3115297 RepID=UPI003906271B
MNRIIAKGDGNTHTLLDVILVLLAVTFARILYEFDLDPMFNFLFILAIAALYKIIFPTTEKKQRWKLGRIEITPGLYTTFVIIIVSFCLILF